MSRQRVHTHSIGHNGANTDKTIDVLYSAGAHKKRSAVESSNQGIHYIEENGTMVT